MVVRSLIVFRILMNRSIIFIVFVIGAHSHTLAASSECSEDVDMFLSSPNKQNYTAIYIPEKLNCWSTFDRSNVKLTYLLNSVSRGNSWAARYLINHIEKLGGGNLEDSLIALGEFAEHDMEKLLSFASEGILSEYGLRSSMVMFTLSLSDNLKAQLNALRARKDKIINVRQAHLSRERTIALKSINEQIRAIESHMQIELNVEISKSDLSNLPANLAYLEANFDELYEKDYQNFWEILHHSLEEARHCKSIGKTSKYLGLVKLQSGNAEFDEFFSESIEKLCVNSPKCFNEASQLLSKPVQKKLKAILENPLYIDKERLYESNCLNAEPGSTLEVVP